MELTAEDADRTIDLVVGDTLTMRLGANPGTGFQWEVTASDDGVMSLTDQTFDAGADDEGSPGQDVLVLTADGPGSAEVTFDYRRPWETGVEPERTIIVQVTVADAEPGTGLGAEPVEQP